MNTPTVRTETGSRPRIIDLRDEVVGTRLLPEDAADLAEVARHGGSGASWGRLWRYALAGDVLALAVGLWAHRVLAPGSVSVPALVGLLGVWVAVLAAEGCYDNGRLWTAVVPLRRLVRVAALSLLFSGTVELLLRAPAVPVGLVLTQLGLVVALRMVLAAGVRLARRRGVATLELVAVGPTDQVRRLLDRASHGWRVTAACVPEPVADITATSGNVVVPVVGKPVDAARVARSVRADVVWVAPGALDRAALRRLGWQLGRDVRLLVSPGFDDVHTHRLDVHLIDQTPVLELRQPRFTGGQLLLKTAIDRSVSALALLTLLPVLLVLVLVVRLDSPGPAVFRQRRVGLNGTMFTCYKLRSMYLDAEARRAELAARNSHAGDGVLFKVRDDPRVTRVGRWMRKLSLDELPQLVNVLKGDMSLVGPRPPLPHEAERYEVDVRRRLLVKPGLTGLWQVSGRADLEWQESVRLDLYYVDNWSPWLDTRIVLQTVHVVLTGRGAY